jgi:RDD family
MVGLALGVVLVAAWETVWVALAAGTPGKLVCGLRVRQLDRKGRVAWPAAAKRGATVAALTATVAGIPVLVASVMLSPLRRGFHDRRSGTVVVESGLATVASTDLPALALRDRPVRPTPFGLAAPVDRRLAARMARLDGSAALVGALVALLAAVQLADGLALVAAASVGWLAVFVADEAWRVASGGANPGHTAEGLRVVDVRTGRAPGGGRSLARALVLAPLLYVPPLQLVLLVWVARSKVWRGPHDLAARTVVVQAGTSAAWG